MKRVLFIDRDGTLIREPPDFQVDCFTKLELLPGVITFLGKIATETDFELVLVSNQDGLGTPSFPRESFYPAHNFLIELLENEQIRFSEICIDCSFEHENKETRKPGTAMLTKYFSGDYDLKNSFVIGDRPTDVKLAENLGAKAIFVRNSNFEVPVSNATVALAAESWREIYDFLRLPPRVVSRRRKTNETDIDLTLNLDGRGNYDISTGIAFFDHMLEQFARHGRFDLTATATGDLHIDEHHTIEDVAITLGEALNQGLGDKMGLRATDSLFRWTTAWRRSLSTSVVGVGSSGTPSSNERWSAGCRPRCSFTSSNHSPTERDAT